MAGADTEPIRSRPAYELVAESIERSILAGRLRPGDPIGIESELVRRFGVNRSTVREGIRLLEQSGLVARDEPAAAGGRAALPSPRMSRALILQQVTFRELWHTSRALEPAAVEPAMDNATSEDLAALRANIALTKRAERDPAQVADLDAEFPPADRPRRTQSRAVARQRALEHAGQADHRTDHLQEPGGNSQADRRARAHPRGAREARFPPSAGYGLIATCATGRRGSSGRAWTSAALWNASRRCPPAHAGATLPRRYCRPRRQANWRKGYRSRASAASA
jgi:GntR family transcriptional regulator, transcriptional repressor for pyruvate dehydrogenase complex